MPYSKVVDHSYAIRIKWKREGEVETSSVNTKETHKSSGIEYDLQKDKEGCDKENKEKIKMYAQREKVCYPYCQ